MKRIVSALISTVMLFTCSTAVFAISDNEENNESIENIIANQEQNNPDDFDENGVRKATPNEITGLSKKVYRYNDETGTQVPHEVKYNIKFDKLYGIIKVDNYYYIPVVAEGSKMTFEFTENSQYAEHPLFSDRVIFSDNDTKWSTRPDGSNPRTLQIYSNNRNYISSDKSIFHKDNSNTYSYDIQGGYNTYMFQNIYADSSIAFINYNILELSETDINDLRTKKLMMQETEDKFGYYPYSTEPLYELIFGESLSAPEGITAPHTYTTKADPHYIYDWKTGTTNRVDNNIDLTFDECYGTIKIYTESGVLTAEASGIDSVIEIPVVKANSKMHIDLSNSKYDAEEYNKNNYSSTDYSERRKCWRYAASNDASRADIIVNGGYSVFVNRDEGNSFGYVSSNEMWYRMDTGFLNYVMNYDGDIEAYVPLKFVLTLDDEQLWELKQFNSVTFNIRSSTWTYSFDGLYETVFNEPAPPTEITNVSADATENDSISVNVDTSCTRGKSVFAVSYKDGVVVDTKDVLGGKATLEGNADNVKVFCWKSLESMIPLCPVGETEVQ